MMLKMSVHARKDRMERLVYLATEIGLGEIALSLPSGNAQTCITTTGLLIVIDEIGQLITAYLPDIHRVSAMYWEKHGRDANMPMWLYNVVLKNQKNHGAYIKKINAQYHK